MNLDTVAMNEISKKWGWILAIGVLMVILGTIGIGATFALTLTTVMFFGILILIGSGFQLLDAFRYKGWSLIGKMLIALLYLAVGFIMVKNPLLASTTLTLFIAWALIAVGIVRIIMAFQLRGVDGWVWTLISGIAAIVLGIMILNNWPESGLWVIGMFVAIELIFNGWGMIMLALAAKNRRSGEIQR
jgi:uncharacterized membrane protein HdeD (DUF308 family)